MSVPSMLRVWWLGARPRTLPAAIVPVLVGGALAARELRFALLPFLAAIGAALLIQVGTNLANDVADYLKGTDQNRRGPTRITQGGLATPAQTIAMAAASFGLAALLGVYLVSVGGWPILAIGVLSIAAGVAYTSGPFPLAYNGLGDVFAFLFFGVIAVCGTYYLFSRQLSMPVVIASLPVAMLVTNIIVVNNLRDMPTDRQSGKHTLAVLIGERATRWEYTVFAFGAGVISASLWWGGWLGANGAQLLWAPVLAIGAALAADRVRRVWVARTPAQFNAALAATAQFHLLFGAAFAACILAS